MALWGGLASAHRLALWRAGRRAARGGGTKIWRVAEMAECPELGLGSFGYLGLAGTAGVVGGLMDSAVRLCIEQYMVLRGRGLGWQIDIGES